MYYIFIVGVEHLFEVFKDVSRPVAARSSGTEKGKTTERWRRKITGLRGVGVLG